MIGRFAQGARYSRSCRSLAARTTSQYHPWYLGAAEFHSSQTVYTPDAFKNTSTSKDESGFSIPPSSPQRKQKVHLHPGPVKPGKSETSHRSPFPPPPPARLSRRADLPSAANPPPHLAGNLGTREMIRHDIQHAEMNGVLKPTPPDASFFTSVTHKAIEITKFYFRGAKAIYTRQKDVFGIRSRLRSGGEPLQRHELRFIRLQSQDVGKVIPFLILALLLEEVIPLLAIYAPFSLPSTCILPAQKLRIDSKKTRKAVKAGMAHQAVFDALEKKGKERGTLTLDMLKQENALSAYCSILRLPTYGFDFLRSARIRKHLNFITEDDAFLLKEDALKEIEDTNLNETLEERGFIVQGMEKNRELNQLKWWLDSVKDTPSSDAIGRRLLLLARIY